MKSFDDHTLKPYESDAIRNHDSDLTVNGVNSTTPTAGIFATYPHGEEISNVTCL